MKFAATRQFSGPSGVFLVRVRESPVFSLDNDSQ